MSRIAVVGAGSIGGACAAPRCAAGHEVFLCVRSPFSELVVEGPDATRSFSPPVFTDPAEVASAAWILLATKSHQTASAAPWLAAMSAPGSVVAVLQNGVEHVERVTPIAGPATVLPVVVNLPAHRRAPGRIVQRRRAHLRVPAGPDGERFAELFRDTDVEVVVSPDFVTDAWRKLCFNAASGAVTCLTGRPLGVVRRPDVAELVRGLVLECIAVARAEGAALTDADAEGIVAALASGPPDRANSMLQDLRAGRPLEWDARNAAVVRIGERHGIPTPLSRAITALLAALDPDPEPS